MIVRIFAVITLCLLKPFCLKGQVINNDQFGESQSPYTWKLDSIATTGFLSDEENKGTPWRLQTFKYDSNLKYCQEQITYSDFDRAKASFNYRHATYVNIGDESRAFERDAHYNYWNQTMGLIQILSALPHDTCIQIYTFDTISNNWLKDRLTCTTYSHIGPLQEKTITWNSNDSQIHYASRLIVVDSTGFKLKEIRQIKQNELDENWITQREIIYTYDDNKLLEKKDFILPNDGTDLKLIERSVWTSSDPNVEVYETYAYDLMDSNWYVTSKEIKTTSQNGSIVATEYFYSDTRTKLLEHDRQVIQYFNEAKQLLRESTFNDDNGRYDLEERVYEWDPIGRMIKESTFFRQDDWVHWDTLEIKTFAYGPADSDTKALIHIKSTNRINGSPIDYSHFKTKFDNLNNLVEFYHRPTFSSHETKVALEYYYDIDDQDVLYPSSVKPQVESSVGVWEKVNPVKRRVSYSYQKGKWRPGLQAEYFYSRIE